MAFDLAAVWKGRRDPGLARAGRALWLAGSASACFAGWTGLAASQEVQVKDGVARDMMFLHGLGNAAIIVTAVGMSAWRWRRRPTLGSTLCGAVASGAALYTAYLGGELVYHHRIGVAGMDEPASRKASPPLQWRSSPAQLASDALRGARWVARRAVQWLARTERLRPGATGFHGKTNGSHPRVPAFHGYELPRPPPDPKV